MQPYRKYNNKKVEIEGQPYQKYKNKKVVEDGFKFASQLERNLYRRLKELGFKLGQDYKLQPRYLLQEKFILNGKTFHKIEYVGDFEITINNITYPPIDAKGQETDVFKIKKKLYAYKYKQEIICIKSVKQFNEWIKGVRENERNQV